MGDYLKTNNKTEVEAQPAVSDALMAAADSVLEALAALRREALAECAASDVSAGDMPAVTIGTGATAENLAEMVLGQAVGVLSKDAAVQTGRVYCYACESAVCEHSSPKGLEDVFCGYRNSGKPGWQPFHSLLLEQDDASVGDLWGDRPKALARFVERKALIADQFQACGRASSTYRILGQVVAGYFRIKGSNYGLTVQLVETRDASLCVQIIAHDRLREALADASPKDGATLYRTFDALRGFRRQVRRSVDRWQSGAVKGARGIIREKLFGGLRRLAGSIERKGRQDQRRSSHAEVRSKDRRPVHKALDDLAAANVDHFYKDVTTTNWIITGKSGRAHVFASSGRHVTSLVLSSDQLDSRTRRKRYLPGDAEALATLQESGKSPLAADGGN